MNQKLEKEKVGEVFRDSKPADGNFVRQAGHTLTSIARGESAVYWTAAQPTVWTAMHAVLVHFQ